MAISVKQQEISSKSRILSRLASEVGESLFALWFSYPDCVAIEGERVTFIADSDFELRRIQRGFGSQLRRIASDVLGCPVTIQYELRAVPNDAGDDSSGKETAGIKSTGAVTGDAGDAAHAINPPHLISLVAAQDLGAGSPGLSGSASSPSQRHLDQRHLDQRHLDQRHLDQRQGAAQRTSPTSPNQPPRGRRQPELRDFFFGGENEFARAAINQLLVAPAQFSPLLIYGGSGSGKSHLLEAVTLELRRRHRFKSCIYLTAEEFTTSFVQSVRGGGLPLFRRKYRDVDVLAIDDVQFFANKRATTSEFQYTIDQLVRSGKQILLASDRAPLELIDLGPEVLNRINSGLVCPLHYAGLETRVEIAGRICRERNLSWSPEVVRTIAERVGKDGRRISGAINTLSAASYVKARAIDQQLIDEMLPSSHGLRGRFTNLSQIEKVLCELFAISITEIRSASRSKKLSNPRMLAMWFCRKYTSSALSEIGEHFGGRSHSTVIAANRRVEEMIEKKEEIVMPLGRYPIAEAIQTIENRLLLN